MSEQTNLSEEQTKLMLDYARLVRLEQSLVRTVADLRNCGSLNLYVNVPHDRGHRWNMALGDFLKERGLA